MVATCSPDRRGSSPADRRDPARPLPWSIRRVPARWLRRSRRASSRSRRGHTVAGGGQGRLRPRALGDVVRLDGVETLVVASPPTAITPGRVGDPNAALGFGMPSSFVQLSPSGSRSMSPCSDRPKRATPDRVQVTAIGGGAEVLPRRGYLGHVRPALAVEDLGLRHELAVRLTPTTTILSPTTAAAAAARAWLSFGSSSRAPGAKTRSDCPEVSSSPGTKPPITTASPL